MEIYMVAIVISMIALAVCILFAINALFKEGVKGLKEKRKPIFSSFAVYAIFLVVFFITQ